MLVQFGNNWIKKIPLTAKLDLAYGLVQFWLSSEFFSSDYFQIGQHLVLLRRLNSILVWYMRHFEYSFMRCSSTTENHNRKSDKKEILTNNQDKKIISFSETFKRTTMFIHEVWRRHALRVKFLWKSWVMNKTLQIFAVFAVFQDELEARITLKASVHNQRVQIF